jgi:WXG100 family type VII secretion target
MSQINQLQAAVEQLASTWRGDAARAFDGLMLRWNTQENALRNALSDIAEALDQSNTTYLSTEADQVASISQVSNALDA